MKYLFCFIFIIIIYILSSAHAIIIFEDNKVTSNKPFIARYEKFLISRLFQRVEIEIRYVAKIT